MKPNKLPIIILASTSPRRKEILNQIKIPFEVKPPQFEENSDPALTPEEEVFLFSRKKAESISSSENQIIIGSDTLIEFEGEKIGKPKSLEDAMFILKRLRGQWHKILTGVVLINTQKNSTKQYLETIRVRLKNYSDEEIKNYVLKDKPLDKAGAYALQGDGRLLIEKLEGDYLAAVGLPLKIIAEELILIGFPLSDIIKKIYQKKEFMNWKQYEM